MSDIGSISIDSNMRVWAIWGVELVGAFLKVCSENQAARIAFAATFTHNPQRADRKHGDAYVVGVDVPNSKKFHPLTPKKETKSRHNGVTKFRNITSGTS